MNPTITKLTQALDNLHTPKPGETFHTENAAYTIHHHLKTHPQHRTIHDIPPRTLNRIIQHHTTATLAA